MRLVGIPVLCDMWLHMLDISQQELQFCASWCRTRDPVLASRAGGLFKLGKDPVVLAENMLANPIVAYVVSLMDMVVSTGESEVDIRDEEGNRKRLVVDIRKARGAAAQDREHEAVMRSVELEGKALGLMVEKRDISMTAVMKDPSKLTLSEMRKLLDVDLVDVTP